MKGSYTVLVLFAFLVEGVFGDTDEVKSVMEGDLVALNTDVIKQKEDDIIQWYFNNALIAMINGHPNTSCNYDGEGGRFIDRLKVDYKTGSLTITDITTEHAGRYEAELITSQSSGTIKKLNIPSKCDHTKITPKSSTHDKIIKSFSLTVSAVPGSGRSSAAVAGISAGVAVLCCWLQLLVV
ncbi:uncharacterized protein [Sinocyclocheilus grahami]|uniref:uncharacterized protein isoform X4 n=1 Tax=Sinocyclocheilus grahami TaxID=75366 RepID=UPI0007AC9A2E|nr:PREDICTED: uncharacterized protein LOC107574545 isoform X4 [Sinocyclocheilus grahami]